MAMAMMADVASSAIGVSPPVFQFLVAFLGSIPCSYLWRFIPSSSSSSSSSSSHIGMLLRHWYAALTGCYLSYLAFGPLSVIHFIPPMLFGYASMAFARPYAGLITFLTAFAFLIAWLVSLSLSLILSLIPTPSFYLLTQILACSSLFRTICSFSVCLCFTHLYSAWIFESSRFLNLSSHP